MNLNQLEYFVEVADNLSFTKAANKCYISQTAMTQQIKALEKTVGVPLLIRDKHHVELTMAGEVFLKEARAILERSHTALKMARIASDGVVGNITIGFICGYGQNELSEILREFHSSYPNIQISLVRDNSSVLFNKLEKGECDVIFTITPPYRQTLTQMNHLFLNSYPLNVALYAGHALRSKQTLKYPDLIGSDFILMQPAGRAKDEAEESMLIYDKGGFFPNIVSSQGDPETLFTLVSIGMGISILPEYVIRPFQKNVNVKIVPLVKEDGSAETLDFEVSWPMRNTNPAVNQLIEIIQNKGY